MLVTCTALSFALLVSACSDDEATGPSVVTFEDERLEAQVRLALGFDATTVINTDNILALEELDLDAESEVSGDALSGIENLSGIEHAANLTYIHLGYTSVTDLTPIKDLKKVQYLRINNTAITDLSAVSGYTTLTYFNANTVRGITNISPLAGNTGMKEIILRDVPFGNAGMSTIAKFTVLYRINMRNTAVTDISVLGTLMQGGALLDSTPGAEAAGGADLDLRQLSVTNWSPIEPYIEQISNLQGYSPQ